MLLLSDDDVPKKDSATTCLFGSLTTPKGHPQEKAVVAKSPPPLPKKITLVPAPTSKRPKRVAMSTTSLEAHRPTTLSDNVSFTSCIRLSLFFIYFFTLLPSADINAEVPLSW
jgi:hypothetical protein